MGLVYSSADASELIDGMNANLASAERTLDSLEQASRTLTDSIGDGKPLDGEAFKKGSDLFSEIIIPTISRTVSTCDNIKQKLADFTSANDQVSSEGILDEDKLLLKKAGLVALKVNAEISASSTRAMAAGADAISFGTLGQTFRDSANALEAYANELQSEIRKIEAKLKRLRDFDQTIAGLFNDEVGGLTLVTESVATLSKTKVNAKNGKYDLPKTFSFKWYSDIFSKDQEKMGYAAFASGALWVDSSGQLCCDGSAEARAFLLNLQTQKEFEIGGIKFNSSGMAFVGAKASAQVKANLSEEGFNLSAHAEAMIGVKVGTQNGFKVGKGILSASGKNKAEAMIGAWGKANGELDINKYGISAYGDFAASAGAEADASSEFSIADGLFGVGFGGDAFAGAQINGEGQAALDVPKGNVGLGGNVDGMAGASAGVSVNQTVFNTKTTADVSVRAGVGFSVGGNIGMRDGHIKGEADLGAALGLGASVKLKFDVDVFKPAEQAAEIVDFVQKFI